MGTENDYYRILGVLDDAEDIVIRAAYRALAQRYHPDKWRGDQAEATRRMAELPLYFVAYILLCKRLAASTQEDHLITEILTSGTSHDMKAQLDSMRYA